MSSSLLSPPPGSPLSGLLRPFSDTLRVPTSSLLFFRRKAGPAIPRLPKATAYIFVKGLISRTLLDSVPPSIQYTCQQPNCTYSKVVEEVSTGNFIRHYQGKHKGILLTDAEERLSIASGKSKTSSDCMFLLVYILKRTFVQTCLIWLQATI
jgi:hypothetical protein